MKEFECSKTLSAWNIECSKTLCEGVNAAYTMKLLPSLNTLHIATDTCTDEGTICRVVLVKFDEVVLCPYEVYSHGLTRSLHGLSEERKYIDISTRYWIKPSIYQRHADHSFFHHWTVWIHSYTGSNKNIHCWRKSVHILHCLCCIHSHLMRNDIHHVHFIVQMTASKSGGGYFFTQNY